MSGGETAAAGTPGYRPDDASVPLRFGLGGCLAAMTDALVFAPGSTLGAAALGFVLASALGAAFQRALRAPTWLVPALAGLAGVWVALELGALDKWQVHPATSVSTGLAVPILCGLTALISTSAMREGGRVPGVILALLTCSCVGALRTAPTLQSYPALGAVVATTQLVAAGTAFVVLAPPLPMSSRGHKAWIGVLCLLTGGLAAAPTRAFSGVTSSCATEFGLKLVRTLSDVDRDGASALFGGQDCAPWRSGIGPFARDIPGDGIDQNCVGGDAPTVATLGHAADGVASGTSVLLITVDTVRYGSTSLGRTDRDTTPALARFAYENTQFTRAFAAGSWTSISLGCLTRGRSARTLGWRKVYETDAMELLDVRDAPRGQRIWSGFFVVDDDAPTFADRARAAGVSTRAIVDAGPSGFFAPEAGLQQGFEQFVVQSDVPDAGIAEVALEWLSETSEPQLVWAHFFGPHLPSTIHEGVPTYGTSVRDRYDHELRAFDAALKSLLEGVSARDDLLVIVTADHGEAIGPFGRSHGFDLTDELLQVPLVVSGPGFGAGSRVDAVGHSHLAPTILAALLGVDEPRSLEHPQTSVVFADTWKLDRRGQATLDLSAAIDADGMAVRDLLSGEERGQGAALGLALDEYLNGPSVVAGRVQW